MEKRKVIQIAATKADLFALCDDGSMWVKPGSETDWELVWGVPQGPTDPPKAPAPVNDLDDDIPWDLEAAGDR